MSIFSNIFGGGNQNQNQPNQNQAQPQPAQPGNIPANTTASDPQLPNTAPNGAIPEQQKEVAPLDEFKDLWKNDPIKEGELPPDTSVFGKVNSEDLMKAAGAIDFTKVVTPEMMQAIQAGGEEGTRALMQAMNKTQQLGYAQSAHATTLLIEQAISKAREQFVSEIPKHIRDRNSVDLIKETPAYSHPAAAPLVESITRQMQIKYPNATAKELNDMANSYVTQFANAITKKEVKESPVDKREDWATFLNS